MNIQRKTAPTPPAKQELEPESISVGWESRLLRTNSDPSHPLSVLANAIIAFEHAPDWQDVLHFDESSLAVVAKTAPPWDETRTPPFAWTDADDIRAAAWLPHHEIMVGKEIAGQAVQVVAGDHRFHPIRDYFGSLEWDGTKRIDTWLAEYLGAEATPYTRAVGPRWLISGVARAYKPGCKCDCCLILEGSQGALKSTALSELGTPWFTDELSDLGSKDAALQLLGAWIIELSELDAMQGAGASRIKAFISRSVDRYRPPYGRRVVAVPRQCIFAGTVNHETYFKDETGARRFWPVKTGCIKIVELKRDRDQLWAEARERYEGGRSWWLENSSLVKLAANEQRARYESDPWDDRIAAFIDSRESVSVPEVLELCIKKPKQQWVQADQNRVARSLCSLGLVRFRDRIGTKRPWRYRRGG